MAGLGGWVVRQKALAVSISAGVARISYLDTSDDGLDEELDHLVIHVAEDRAGWVISRDAGSEIVFVPLPDHRE